MKGKKKYVGIDLHKSQFTTCVRGRTDLYEEYPAEGEGYERFLRRVKAWQEQGYRVVAAVESTGNTRYFKNRMEAAGVEVKVINTLDFKVVNESVHKTDKYDARTIAEFLEADMLPEAGLCSEASEKLRRLLKGRTLGVRMSVAVKNQIHGLLTGLGMRDSKKSLQSKKGRQRVLDALKGTDYELVVQPFFDTIAVMEIQVKRYEQELRRLTAGDAGVELLMSIPGCGEITAWTIRAFTDDIRRFASPKKYAACAGLAPWVQSSNGTVHLGKITKRGPEELRTALVQLVMGILRQKEKTAGWRLMSRYVLLKKHKGSGKSIVATARKLAVIVWNMLTEGRPFDVSLMTDRELSKKAAGMRMAGFDPVGGIVKKAIEPEGPPCVTAMTGIEYTKNKNIPLVAKKKIKEHALPA